MKGFIPLPNYFFLKENVSNIDVLWCPRYNNDAYKVVSGELTEKELLNHIGKPAILLSGNKIGFVIQNFIEDDEMEFLFFYYSKEEQTSIFESVDDISEIRKVNFSGEIKTDSTDVYSFLLNNYLANSVVVTNTINNNILTLQIHNYCKVSGDEFLDVVNNYSSVLRLIADPLLNIDGCYKSSQTKLASLLNNLLEKSEYDSFYNAEGILPEIANGIIINASCKMCQNFTNPNFDSLSNDELLTLIKENVWETWEIKIEVSDSAWIEHFENVKPYVFKPTYEEEAQEWAGVKLQFKDNL